MGICPWSKKRRNMKQKRRTISTDNEDEITKYLNECIVASSSKFEKICATYRVCNFSFSLGNSCCYRYTKI